MKNKRIPHPETRIASGLGWTDEPTGAITLPLHVSSTFRRDADYEMTGGWQYSRDDTPNLSQLEAMLAELERGAAALVFASGIAACTAPFQALRSGDHAVVPDNIYYTLTKWLTDFARGWGIEITIVPNGDLVALARVMQPGKTRLVWIETPSNPLWIVTDIAAAARIAHDAGAKLAVDSTAATPVCTNPLELGADLVCHSATKYLNGHSDLLAGAIVTREADATWGRIRDVRTYAGAVLGGFEVYLLNRGLRTLFLRVRRQSESALAIARFLERHPRVSRVRYPGLASDPGHEIALRQMPGGFGGMLSFEIDGDAAAALRVARSTTLFKPATSLGGVESLIEHRKTVEGPRSPVPDTLLRLSVGIEHADDLIDDLTEALAKT